VEHLNRTFLPLPEEPLMYVDSAPAVEGSNSAGCLDSSTSSSSTSASQNPAPENPEWTHGRDLRATAGRARPESQSEILREPVIAQLKWLQIC